MTAARVQRWLAVALVVLVAALIATGVWLALAYRPGAPSFVTEPHHHASPVRFAHRWTAIALIPCAVALLVVSVRGRRWMLPAGLSALALVAAFTGPQLAWDQLALRAVTVNRDVRGTLFAAFNDQVRFVLVDGYEVSQAAYRNALGVHVAVALAVAVLVTVIVAGRQSERL